MARLTKIIITLKKYLRSESTENRSGTHWIKRFSRAIWGFVNGGRYYGGLRYPSYVLISHRNTGCCGGFRFQGTGCRVQRFGSSEHRH